MIGLKKSKAQVLEDIHRRAMDATYNSINQNQKLQVDTGPIMYMIQNAIAAAVTAGFNSLLENQYTDDDFEKDLTLK